MTAVAEKIHTVGSTTPRLFTPPLKAHADKRGVLKRDWSWGYDCVDFLENVAGWTLLDWQRWLYIAALEKGADGTGFRFSTIVLTVSRQNGKSQWLKGLGLWRLYADEYGRSLPGCPGAKTALLACQNLKYAETMLKDVADDVKASALLRAEFRHHRLDNGSNRIELSNGRSWRVVAANRRGGRGLAVDIVMLDELREHQTWDAWEAIVPTTTARPFKQIVCCSNAGDAKSEVLRTLRDGAKRRIASGDTEGTELGLWEWSLPPDSDPRDESLWYLANPALGSQLFGIADLRGYLEAQQYRNMPGFMTEHCCMWVDALEPGVLPAEHWAETHDSASARAADAPVFGCVDVNYTRTRSYVAVAAARPDGNLHVEVIAGHAGTDWVIDWLAERKQRFASIAVQKTSAPVSGLIPDMIAAGLPIVGLPVGLELQTACGLLYDGICEHKIFHRPAPLLDRAAASGLARSAGDAWVFDRRNSPVDVAPLVAVAGAVWLAGLPEAPQPACHAWPDEATLATWENQSTGEDDDERLARAWLMTT
jgi:hypothetical protein